MGSTARRWWRLGGPGGHRGTSRHRYVRAHGDRRAATDRPGGTRRGILGLWHRGARRQRVRKRRCRGLDFFLDVVVVQLTRELELHLERLARHWRRRRNWWRRRDGLCTHGRRDGAGRRQRRHGRWSARRGLRNRLAFETLREDEKLARPRGLPHFDGRFGGAANPGDRVPAVATTPLRERCPKCPSDVLVVVIGRGGN